MKTEITFPLPAVHVNQMKWKWAFFRGLSWEKKTTKVCHFLWNDFTEPGFLCTGEGSAAVMMPSQQRAEEGTSKHQSCSGGRGWAQRDVDS